MRYLRYQNSTDIIVGPILASSDGITPFTTAALTTAPAIMLFKNGSTAVNRGSTGAVVARINGYYTVPISTVDSGTYGQMRLDITESTDFLPIWEDFTIVSDNVYDSLYGGSTYLQTNVILIETVDATNQLKAAVNDSTCENGITNQEAMRMMLSVLCGESTGAGSTTIKFRDAGSSSITRVQAEVGSSGNRVQMTLKSSS